MRERQPDLKVLFVTGYATSAVVSEGGDREQRAVLPKPFEPQRLLSVVREVLDVGRDDASCGAPAGAGDSHP